jgi:hypothetical protein
MSALLPAQLWFKHFERYRHLEPSDEPFHEKVDGTIEVDDSWLFIDLKASRLTPGVGEEELHIRVQNHDVDYAKVRRGLRALVANLIATGWSVTFKSPRPTVEG